MKKALPRLGKGAAFGQDSTFDSTSQRRAKARLTCHPSNGKPFIFRGKRARVLRMLATAPRGMTPQDCLPWMTRLAAVICVLRHKHGLSIVTVMERHDDGRHARYTLTTPVKLEA